MSAVYDLVLSGGRVIDPARAVDDRYDVAVKDGRVAAVAADIPKELAVEVVDVSGKLVLPGLIDPHSHLFRHVGGVLGMDANWVGVGSGVTSLVDQGTVGAATLQGYVKYVVEERPNRIFVFLSPYLAGAAGGLLRANYSPETIDIDRSLKAFTDYQGLVKGMKFWAEQVLLDAYGLEPLEKTVRIADEAGVPIYFHLGELWPPSEETKQRVPVDQVLPRLLPLMRPGDIFAHAYTAQPGGYFDAAGRVRPEVKEALAMGMKVDLGYGAATSIDLARRGIEQGFVPDTLGADIHGSNTLTPDPTINPGKRGAFTATPGVVSGMNLMMACGLPLKQVVPMATTNPARIFLKLEDEVGTLSPGVVADVSVLHDEPGSWRIRDNKGGEIMTERMLSPWFCLRAGRRFDADSPILRQAELQQA